MKKCVHYNPYTGRYEVQSPTALLVLQAVAFLALWGGLWWVAVIVLT